MDSNFGDYFGSFVICRILPLHDHPQSRIRLHTPNVKGARAIPGLLSESRLFVPEPGDAIIAIDEIPLTESLLGVQSLQHVPDMFSTVVCSSYQTRFLCVVPGTV